MAAFKHAVKGVIKHVVEGSWQHDYMLDNPDLWPPATPAEVAASFGIYVPPADDPEPVEDTSNAVTAADAESETKPVKVRKPKVD